MEMGAMSLIGRSSTGGVVAKAVPALMVTNGRAGWAFPPREPGLADCGSGRHPARVRVGARKRGSNAVQRNFAKAVGSDGAQVYVRLRFSHRRLSAIERMGVTSMIISRAALAIALGSFVFTGSAASQIYGGAQKKEKEEIVEQEAKSTEGRKLKISPKAQKAIVELQNAVKAKDAAAIPGKLAAAQKVAESPDEKFFVAVNQTQAAIDANDLAGIRAGLDAMEASGGADNKILVSQYTNLGIKYYEAKQNDLAAAALERAVALDGNNPNSVKLLGNVRDVQGRKAEAIALLQKSLALSKAAGQNPKENDYKFAAKLAYEAKAPVAADITRAWLADYPNPTNWRDALRIYRDVNGLDGEAKIDVMRLARAAN